MSTSNKGIPVSWAQLCDPAQGPVVDYEEELESLSGLVARAQPHKLRTFFLGREEDLAAVAALRGPEACLPTLQAVAPQFARAVEILGPRPLSPDMAAALSFLGFSAVTLGCGGPPPPPTLDERVWLDALLDAGELPSGSLPRLAFMACAVGRADRVPALLRRKPEAFQPGRTFGFDVSSFALYLCSAVSAGASLPAITPAWDEFLHAFPHKLAASTLRWIDLFTAARVVHAWFGRRPLSEVAAALHERVAVLATESRDERSPALGSRAAPTSAPEAMITRLRAVDWSTLRAEHRRSRVALMKEFLRRSALWSEALGCPERWPFFDIAGATDSSAPQPEIPAEIASLLVPSLVRNTFAWMLRWAARTSKGPEALPDPYEPLLWFFERGGGFTVEQRMIDVDLAGIPIRNREAYLRAAPFTELDRAALDALDRGDATPSGGRP